MSAVHCIGNGIHGFQKIYFLSIVKMMLSCKLSWWNWSQSILFQWHKRNVTYGEGDKDINVLNQRCCLFKSRRKDLNLHSQLILSQCGNCGWHSGANSVTSIIIIAASLGDSLLMSLTHGCRAKMAAILQTTFSIAFSWMKTVGFWFKFHWIQFSIIQHWLR